MVGFSGATVFAATVVLVAGIGYAWARQPAPVEAGPLPVPGFSTSATGAGLPRAAPRATLLPTDCADLLPGQPDMSALLGRPTDSVGVRSVIGLPAPAVGQLERLTCNYQVRGGGDGLSLTIAAFTDPGSAAAQRDRNIAAEHLDTVASTSAPLGEARATMLSQRSRQLLMIAYDRYTVTATMAPGVVADNQSGPVLTDLVQRVLPHLAPPAH
jgi:hypothetical protein